MMRTKFPCSRTGMVVVAAIVAGATVVWLTRPSEPSYQGRTLSEWLVYFDQRVDEKKKHDEVIGAIRAMGTNCLPIALKLLSDEPSGPFAFAHQNDRSTAQYIFQILGDRAKPAIPELIQLTKHPNTDVRLRSFLILLGLKPDKATLVPVLVSLVNDTDKTIRQQAAIELDDLAGTIQLKTHN